MVAIAGIVKNIVGSCTFHTNQVLFQLGMLIYTQSITEKCQNLFCTYEGHIFTTRNKNCLKYYQIENLFKKKETNHFNPNLSKFRFFKTILGKLGFKNGLGKMRFGKLVLSLAAFQTQTFLGFLVQLEWQLTYPPPFRLHFHQFISFTAMLIVKCKATSPLYTSPHN